MNHLTSYQDKSIESILVMVNEIIDVIFKTKDFNYEYKTLNQLHTFRRHCQENKKTLAKNWNRF
jgi:hypothetical protein